MGRNIILSVLLLLFQSVGFSQSHIIDSLKNALRHAKDDTIRLGIYIAMGEACEKKDHLLYAEPALLLSDKILSAETDNKQYSKILEQETKAYDLMIAYYTGSSGVEWDKVFHYIESRIKIIERSGNKKRVAETLLYISGLYLYVNDTAKYLANAQKSLMLFKAIDDVENIVNWYIQLRNYYLTTGDLSKAVESIQSAIKISKDLNYKKGLAISLSGLADMYRDNGEDAQAMENYNNALSVLKETKDTADLFNVTAAIGGLYFTRHNTAKALEYYNNLLLLFEKKKNEGHKIGSLYKWIGIVYRGDKKYDNAIFHLQKSLSVFDSLNDKEQVKYVLDEIGSVYHDQGVLEKAIAYHRMSVKLSDTMDWTYGKAISEYLLALDYYTKNDYINAKENNDKALSVLSKQADVKPISDAVLLASQIDSAKGDGDNAYKHYKEYISLINKIKGEEIRKAAQKESFQNVLNRKEIEQVKKDNEARKIKNQQYYTIAVLGVIALAVFIVALIQYKSNKHKQQANIALRKEKEKVESTLSELKSAQAQLIQSEKMASLGQLTAGIAHEIQNPLNFVNNFSEVNKELIEELRAEKDDPQVAEEIINDIVQNLDKIIHHGKRAESIVKGMLQHSRASTGKKELTDINALVDECVRLSYHGMRAKDKEFNASINTDLDENIGRISIVPQDTSRVLLNLFNNAFYAVDEKKRQQNGAYEPTVSICTKKLDDKVEIHVKDNGNGIPQSIIDKIFQPFFTTKPTGQGTGLGLSLSYDIIKANGGEIMVNSMEGEGAEFIISITE